MTLQKHSRSLKCQLWFFWKLFNSIKTGDFQKWCHVCFYDIVKLIRIFLKIFENEIYDLFDISREKWNDVKYESPLKSVVENKILMKFSSSVLSFLLNFDFRLISSQFLCEFIAFLLSFIRKTPNVWSYEAAQQNF